MQPSLGFIGLGIMGRGMAANLLRKGHALTVWNRTASRMAPFVAQGAVVAMSPAALAAQCDIVLICVSDTPDVAAVLHGEAGLLAGLREGTLVVDHSTISPQATREFAAKVAEKGASWLDAPISGGSEGAERGTLSIMVGGSEGDFERARPIMAAYGSTITHVGQQGAGQMVKLVNQILVVGTYYAVSEALLFAQAGGLDLARTIAAVEHGAAGSWMLSNRGTQAIVRDWRPGFTIDLQQKDLRLTLEAAAQLGVPLLNSSAIAQLYSMLQRQGLGGEGNHALIKALEQMSGIVVGGDDATG
ncbi:MAG: NAD(P)-dependent oxidoreductase [Anaerolineales bacterium]|nr:NAD(P)-dependent oxidoreductase [Anaerolineales bacterium]MCB9126736.1 NAD(P)-dependent oxidoreductase [Ardenticatenales bacterium]